MLNPWNLKIPDFLIPVVEKYEAQNIFAKEIIKLENHIYKLNISRDQPEYKNH